MTKKVIVAVTAIICLILGGAAGYFGRPLTRPNRDSDPLSRRGTQSEATSTGMARPGQNGSPANGGRALGEVESVTDNRLILQTPTGTQTVAVSGSTNYFTMASSSAGAVTSGTQILVMGQQNDDGSITATSIQIIPAGVNFPVGGRRR